MSVTVSSHEELHGDHTRDKSIERRSAKYGKLPIIGRLYRCLLKKSVTLDILFLVIGNWNLANMPCQ